MPSARGPQSESPSVPGGAGRPGGVFLTIATDVGEMAAAGLPRVEEWMASRTLYLSIQSRLRLGVQYTNQEQGGYSTALQSRFSTYFGGHGHGVNWYES